MTDSLARLRAAGVSVWLDDLRRERLTSGSLAALVRDKHVSGVQDSGHRAKDHAGPGWGLTS